MRWNRAVAGSHEWPWLRSQQVGLSPVCTKHWSTQFNSAMRWNHICFHSSHLPNCLMLCQWFWFFFRLFQKPENVKNSLDFCHLPVLDTHSQINQVQFSRSDPLFPIRSLVTAFNSHCEYCMGPWTVLIHICCPYGPWKTRITLPLNIILLSLFNSILFHCWQSAYCSCCPASLFDPCHLHYSRQMPISPWHRPQHQVFLSPAIQHLSLLCE